MKTLSSRPYSRGLSTDSMPEMKSMLPAPTPGTFESLLSTRPIAWARAVRSAIAAALGRQLSLRAASRMRSAVGSEMRPVPLKTFGTAPGDTPASAATSLIVGRPLPRALRGVFGVVMGHSSRAPSYVVNRCTTARTGPWCAPSAQPQRGHEHAREAQRTADQRDGRRHLAEEGPRHEHGERGRGVGGGGEDR